MTSDRYLERVASGAPPVAPEVARAHRAFLRNGEDASFDPYYSEESARFEWRDDDVLATPGDLEVRPAECGVLMISPRARASLLACGTSPADARAVLAAIDGVRTAREVLAACRVAPATFRGLMGRAFGSVVFAPHAVAALEARVSAAELVRFPGSPYEVVRPYWENLADVAERIADEGERPATSAPSFVGFLRVLHGIALVGASGTSFYRPASPIVAKTTLGPGELLVEASVTEPIAGGARFVSGPRVNAARIGGDGYHSALMASLSAAGPRVPLGDEDALPWGEVIVARADGDAVAAPWFCPPRPLDERHFAALAASYADALGAAARRDAPSAIFAASMLHRRFVRLHPFGFANQCLAMSLVNAALRGLHGAGIPHLVLDHLALSLSEREYAEVFARAVEAWLVTGPPLPRTLELVSRKRRAFELLGALRDASPDTAARIVRERPEDSPLVMLAPRGTPW